MPGWVSKNLHQLDTSHGCQNHTLLPSAASSTKTLRPAHVLPTEIPAKAFKRRSSARRLIAHGKSALRPLARPTLPRPSHPVPNVRDDRDTPLLVGRDARSCKGDFGQSGSELFLRQRIDRFLVICPSGKSGPSIGHAQSPPMTTPYVLLVEPF